MLALPSSLGLVSRVTDVTVRDNPEALRFEAREDGELLGEIRYRTEPGIVVLVHTEVAPSAEGTGVGSGLVKGALDDIRGRGLRVVPVCPFVAAYIRRHPEYADLVAKDPATPD
jgi:predicted GNAT family acetyltransferase